MGEILNIMDTILVDKLRISGFRGLNDFEISLSKVTVLTGVNNSGKTTILKALQLALGGKTSSLSEEDFHTDKDDNRAEKIIIDIRIALPPEPEDGNEEDPWLKVFKKDNIRSYGNKRYVAIRTSIEYNSLTNSFDIDRVFLSEWIEERENWKDINTTNPKKVHPLESIPFNYIDPQRDITEDLKIKSSYLGKILTIIYNNFTKTDLNEIEEQIKILTENVSKKSGVLTKLTETIKDQNSSVNKDQAEVTISPFPLKVRDLNKNFSINYGESGNLFQMSYHGMGTRSWSSLLVFKAFLDIKEDEDKKPPFFPVTAIEEPEAHLHPNAQKQLYKQLKSIKGQKIISTHSPYIAASAELTEIRGLYKNNDKIIECGIIKEENKENNGDKKATLSEKEEQDIKQRVIKTRGELFFSKAIILCEGETEELVLPIYGERFFKEEPFCLGINVIGIGGAGSSIPFIKFAKALNIPYYFLGDKDKEEEVEKQIDKHSLEEQSASRLFFFDEKDYETAIFTEFEDLITRYFNESNIVSPKEKRMKTNKKRMKTDEKCDKCDQFIYKTVYEEELSIVATMKNDKIIHAVPVANLICENKKIPSKIKELFDKIQKDLSADINKKEN